MQNNIYKTMYAMLCAACSAVIDQLDAPELTDPVKIDLARGNLQAALLQAEEYYVENAADGESSQ